MVHGCGCCRQQPTQGDTDAYRRARREWLAFVDDVMKCRLPPKIGQ